MKKIISLSLLSPVIVSPILCLTSCGTNYVEPILMYDMLDSSTWPEINPIQTSEIKSQSEISSFYIDNVKSNPELFVNDMVHAGDAYTREFRHCAEEEGAELTKFELGFTRPTFDTTSISHISAHDETLNTISFKQRIVLVYEKDEDLVHYTQNITVDVDYQNVIFLGYESTSSEMPWCIGLLDQNVGAESFWYYQFDTKPWSISYSCVNEKIKTIKESEGGPSVDIHDSEYYSGMIDDSYKLYNTYLYANLGEDNIEECILNMILLIAYKSTLLSKVGHEVDLRLWSSLYCYGDTEQSPTQLNIYGFAFFKPSGNITNATVTLKDQSVILKEISPTTYSTITLDNNTQQVDLYQPDPKEAYKLGATYNKGDDPNPSPTKTFAVPVDSLTFEINYTKANGSTVNRAVVINLHYTSLTMSPEPTPPEP